MDTRVSRRTFLKSAAVAGGIAAAGALAGCGTSQGSGGANVRWDKEVDFLVVGSGTATFGALSAKRYGLENVLIVEKAPGFGGTSATSGGNFYAFGADCWRNKESYEYTDTEEAFWEYAKACASGRIPDEEAFQSFIDYGNECLNVIGNMSGIEWGVIKPDTVDYYEPNDQWTPDGRGNVSAWNEDHSGRIRGSGVWKKLNEACHNMSIEIMYETRATRLVKDGAGRVTGIAALDSLGKEIFIKATHGVLVGTGGFEFDTDMCKSYLPFPLWARVSVPYNTGDGHKMLMEAGAKMILMDRAWGTPGKLKDEFDWNMDYYRDGKLCDWIMDRGKPGAIVVNKYGKRFANENINYDAFVRALGAFGSVGNNFDNIPAVFVCDSEYTKHYTLLPASEPGEIPEFYFQANTLEEVADHFHLPVDDFVAEVESFNEHARKGVDPVFHRGEMEYDKLHTGDTTHTRDDLANPCLFPLETPPFIACYYVPGTMSTCGGAKINKHAQAVDLNDNPIPGLFVSGATSGNIAGGSYLGSGFTLANGAVMAYVAGKYASGMIEE